MVGGRARALPPRELTDDPEAWPDRPSADLGAEAVREVSRSLAAAITDRGLSLRGASAASGVNRQAIADLLAGRSWPDVATVARLGVALDVDLWPPSPR